MKTVKLNYGKFSAFALIMLFYLVGMNTGIAQSFDGNALVSGLESETSWVITLGKWFVRLLMIGGACFIVYLAVWDANGKDKLRPYLSQIVFAFIVYAALETMWQI